MPLLTSTAELDLAIGHLDPVITGFPTLIAARHARATAYHRKWLNTAPVQVQLVRASLYTYTARFAPWVTEGTPIGDALALQRARRDYAAILVREEIPGTLANLALLDGYAGNLRLALKRAAWAARLAPTDAQIRNDLGVVLFLSGNRRAALRAFIQASDVSGDPEDPVLAFNLAKCAALAGDRRASTLLERYLELDPCSGWRGEALTLLGRTTDVEGRCLQGPPAVGDGVTLGISASEVTARLGSPTRVAEHHGIIAWRFDPRGLAVVFGVVGNSILIELMHADAGRIDGVRVGDDVQHARERWGCPSERGEGYLVFWSGEWGVGVEHEGRDGGVIRSLSLACRD